MTNTALNVLVYTSLFPSLQSPTRGVFNLHGFLPLTKVCRVGVVAPVPVWLRLRSPRAWLSPRTTNYEGIEVSYPTYWVLPGVAHHLHARWIYRSVRRHVMERHRVAPFDAIIGSFAYPDVVVAARLADDLGCPLISLVLGSDMNELAQRPLLRPQIKDAFDRSRLVVALTQPLRAKVLALGIPSDKVVVQHNGVDGARFIIRNRDDARQYLKFESKFDTLLFVGNLVHEKGPDVLLEAFGRLHADPSCCARLVFIGDGDMAGLLRDRAAQLGLSQHIHFLGRQSPDKVAWWMAASDVLCLPSRREGCPNVVLEALASGRPVVATAVGGVPELITSTNGLMVSVNDPRALASEIQTALQKKWDPLEVRASLKSLSWEGFSRLFYEAIAGSSASPPAERAFSSTLDESRAQ